MTHEALTFRNPFPLEANGDRMSLSAPALAVYRELRAHGEEAFPHECCGALLGRMTAGGWQVDSLVRATNTRDESRRDRYEIAPAELVKIAREARSRGLEIAGFYHSHPEHPARWSATDLEEAHWLGCVNRHHRSDSRQSCGNERVPACRNRRRRQTFRPANDPDRRRRHRRKPRLIQPCAEETPVR